MKKYMCKPTDPSRSHATTQFKKLGILGTSSTNLPQIILCSGGQFLKTQSLGAVSPKRGSKANRTASITAQFQEFHIGFTVPVEKTVLNKVQCKAVVSKAQQQPKG